MQVSKVGIRNNLNISKFQRVQNPKSEVGITYSNVPSFWGRDLVVKMHESPLPQELLELMPQNTTIQEIIAQAQKEENKLGQGANSIVYTIPEFNGYVLKVLNKDDPNKIDLKEFPSSVNLGQPVWQDDKNPRVLILKKIQGEEHSIPNWSNTVGKPLQVTIRQAKQFANQLAQIAQMPQKSFDQLAFDVKLLDDKGYKLDSINPNNLIVDGENDEIHIIDYFKVKPREAHLYKNSCLDLIAVMADFTLFPEFFDKMNPIEKKASIESIKTITDKMYRGCEKSGLSCDDERYVTYINETSKWFPIPSVIDENTGNEYVRAYNVRMKDFIKMVYSPERWANSR